jgi:hypothetical protein
MHKFYGPKFFELAKEAGRIREAFSEPEKSAAKMDPESRTNNVPVLQNHAHTLRGLGLLMSAMQADKIIARLKDDEPLTTGEFARLVNELYERLSDECSALELLLLSPIECQRYAPSKPLFGADFAAKFPTNGAFELDEAAKCMALGRPTAAVFHLMRIMELGIRALADCLGLPDPTKPADRNWGVILKAIWNGIEKKWPKSADRMAGDGRLFEDLYVSLDAVKNPWRNSTMHVENKYTDDEAEHIFTAVMGFMKKIASRMDENGKPMA